MPITPFGWVDNASPDITAANLELSRSQVGTYTDRKWPTDSVTPEAWGAKCDVIEFSDGAITSGSTTLTSASITSSLLPGGAGSKNFYIVWGGAGTSAGHPSAGLSTGAPITSIPRTAGASVPMGPILIEEGTHSQFFWTTAVAAANGSIPVGSQTPNFAYTTAANITFAATGLRGTVSSVSTGSMVLSVASSHTLSGVTGWFGTDDTAAIQSAVNSGFPVVFKSNGKYLVDGAATGLQTTNQSYALISFPSGFARPIALLGHGTDIYCTRLGDAYNATYGVPSVIGGPTYEQQPATWSIAATVHVEGLRVRLPDNPSICGMDFSRCIGVAAGMMYPITVDTAVEPGAPYGYGQQRRTNSHAAGIRLPYVSNGGRVTIGRLESYGMYIGLLMAEHTVVHDYLAFQNYVSMGFDVRQTGGGGHANTMLYFDSEGAVYHVTGWRPDTGVADIPASSPFFLNVYELDIEEQPAQNATLYHINDVNSQIIGTNWSYYRWLAVAQQAGFVRNGATKVKVRDIDPSQQGTGAESWVQVFTANGTWTRPPGAQSVAVTAIGGGGGGQSGATGASGVAILGGNGGQAGGRSTQTFNGYDLPATVTVTVGAGGAGGTGISASNTPGGWSGKTGGNTAFGSYLTATGGGESIQGGTGTGGLGSTNGPLGAVAVAGGAGSNGASGYSGAGAAGGGVSTGAVFQGGGAGGAATRDLLASGAGVGVGAAGLNGSSTAVVNIPGGGGGGAGGNGGNATTNGGAGGSGGNYGGGGGGGGGTINTKTSGAGGAGGNGILVVVCS